MLNENDRLDGRYLILAILGQGGMSYVYRALDEKLDREVAIKVLKEELAGDTLAARRFMQEARAAAGLSSPNIVATYDIVDSGDYHYIVMELVEGVTLKKYIARKGILSDKEAIGIALQAAAGLGEAHRAGIVHRDVKPQNIIISRDGKIKVSDFGIAVISEEDEADGELIVGSAHYISPEQVETGAADQRSDIYSLGITMYEMLTGRVPYSGESAADIALMHVEDTLVPPRVLNRSISTALNDIILKAAAKDPDERYSSCEELAADLRRAAEEPEGHFVRLLDAASAGGGEKEQSKDEESKALETSAGQAQDETRAFGGEESREDSDDKRMRMVLYAFVAALAIILIVFSVVMMTRSRTPRTLEDTALGEPSSAAESEMSYTISIEGEDLVPDVTGMRENLARARLSEFGLSMDSSATEYSDTYESGIVIRQNPGAGELFSVGTTVFVTLSAGSVLDDIADDSIEEASDKLSAAGISLDETYSEQFSEEIAQGRVIGVLPMDGDEEGVYRLIVSLGSESDYAPVPDLIGMSAASARSALEAIGLTIGSVSAVKVEGGEYGSVTAQSTAPGEYLKLGSSVSVNVNVGEDSSIAEGTDVKELTESGSNPDADEVLTDDYYYGSVNATCLIPSSSVLGVASNAVNVSVRLRQNVSGAVEYTHIFGPIPVSLGDSIPVSFRNMRGVYGVEEGFVEVYNPDTGEIFQTYRVEFSPLS